MRTKYSKPKVSRTNQESKDVTLSASISAVPDDMISEIIAGDPLQPTSTGLLTPEEQGHLSSSSPRMFKVTQTSRDTRILQKFLLCVAHGEQDKAEGLLKVSRDKSKWLLGVCEFTDYSNRTFKTATAYEYANWAQDSHMCRMLMAYMDREVKDEIAKRIKLTDRNRGLVYEQDGKTHKSRVFDFEILTEALEAYVDGYNEWVDGERYGEMQDAWMRVGRAQRNVPAHVANEYCRPDRSFRAPGYSFKESTLPRVLTYFNGFLGRDEFWYSFRSTNFGLGINLDVNDVSNTMGIAIIRHHHDKAYGTTAVWRPALNGPMYSLPKKIVRVELKAIKQLELRRSVDFIDLSDELNLSYSDSENDSDSDFCTKGPNERK